MSKKVYELAKEFGIQSKDFAGMLKEINIPVKNHMSVMTEQQEKYFRNNFSVEDGKVIPNSEAGKSSPPASESSGTQPARQEQPNKQEERPQAARTAAQETPSEQKAQPAEQKSSAASSPRTSEQRSQSPQERPAQSGRTDRPQRSQTPDSRSSERTGQQRQGTQYRNDRPRQSSGDQQRSPQQRQGYQGAQGAQRSQQQRQGTQQQGSGSNDQRRQNYQQGTGQQRQGGYQGNQQRPPYQRDGQRPQGGYQGGQGQQRPPYQRDGQRPQGTGQGQQRQGTQQRTWDKDSDSDQRRNQSQRQQPVKKPATAPAGLEKPKSAQNKTASKQKNEQRSKAKENFFNDNTQKKIIDNTKKTRGSKSSYKRRKIEAKEERLTSGVEGVVIIPETISISELSEKILISPADIIKVLMSYGIMANINQSLDFDSASVVSEELGITVQLEEETDIFEEILEEHFEDESSLKTRAPIITVMGHVDHGKTSLLDTIRNTDVTSGESGGITQHIGAYTITKMDKSITFIDTPGHEAFTAMRSRGASVTDIAVLVVAADDGVKPQTIEAINHAKDAGVPIIVAINKIDKPEANAEKVKQELTEYGLVAEEWGGDTICVPVSAKTGSGINELLENILLLAEVEDLKANFGANAVGTVIEARIDKQRGITASLLIKSGTLRDSDLIVSGTIFGRVRVINNDKGQRIESAEPSRAVEMFGFDDVPDAGEKFFVVENEREARRITDRRKDRIRLIQAKLSQPSTFDELFDKINQGNMKEIKLIIKADVQGSFEALKQSLMKLNDNEDGIRINIIHGGVGIVTESDVSLAAASGAVLAAFNVKPAPNAVSLAMKEHIEIRDYNIIYTLIDDMQRMMNGLKDPEYEEVTTAKAEVREVFKIPDIGLIAGCYVTSGTVSRRDKARLFRDGKMIYEGAVSSLKRFKDDVREVASGYECGIALEHFTDLKAEDQLEFYKMEEIKAV